MFRFILALSLIGIVSDVLVAQDKDKAPAAEKAFEEFVARSDAYLAKNGPWLLEIESEWKAESEGKAKNGVNRFRVVIGADRKKFRVEAMKAGDATAPLVVVSDGKSVTHVYAPGKLYSRRDTDDPLDDLLGDALVASSIEGSGIELILRKDLREHVLAHVLKIQDLGPSQVGDRPAHAFQAELANKKRIDVWFSTGQAPLLLKMATSLRVPVQDKNVYQFAVVSTFKWSPAPASLDAEFQVTLPEGAKRVVGLFEAIVRGDTSELIGKKLPALKLASLDGADASIADHAGKGPVVLYLWATWCAPSTQNSAAVAEFVDSYKKKGTTFLSINVGETPEQVKAHMEKSGQKRTALLDAKSATLDAFRLSALPAAVVIAPNGEIRAIASGSGPAFRSEIAQALDSILK